MEDVMSEGQTGARWSTYVAALVFCSIVSSVAVAHSEITIPTREEAQRVNDNKVGVVFTHEELFHQLVHNMESELEHDTGLRIVPIMGKNHVQSVYDLLYLKGVDLALVRADAIEYVSRKGDYPIIKSLVHNVAKVSEEKIVIIARNDYNTMQDLEGQVVGFGLPGSGEYVTSTIAFDSLGVLPDYIEVDNTTAIEKLKSGELAAMVYLLRAPDAILTGNDLEAANAIKTLELGDDLHIMEIAESDELSEIYTPTTLTSADLSGVIEEGLSIPTYSVDAILAVYRWKEPSVRFDQTQRFVKALVDSLDGLQGDQYQPVWKRVDLEQPTPNVVSSPLVSKALETQILERENQAEQERIASAQAAAEAKAEKVEQLIKRRDELTARIGDELNEADTITLERMLEELNTFLEERD